MRPSGKRLARLIWMGAILVLIGDLASVPWNEIARMLANPDIEHAAGLIALIYAQMRSLILAMSLLAGLSSMVEALDKIGRTAPGS